MAYATVLAGHPVEFVGSFDWNDMAYYMLGALLSGLLLWGQRRFIQGSRTAVKAAEEQLRQAEVAEKKARRRTAARRTRKPGQRRGGRR